MNIFNTPTTVLKGVAQKRAETLSELGIDCIYDLINYLPSGYADRRLFSDISNVNDAEEVCIRAFVKNTVKTVRVKGNLTISNCVIYDQTGEISVVWYNQRYVDKQIRVGNEYCFYGRIKKGKNRLELVNPKFEDVNREGYTGKIVPVYPLSSKIPQKTFISIMKDAIKYAEKYMVSTLPACIEKEYHIPDLIKSINDIHFPENEIALRHTLCHRQHAVGSGSGLHGKYYRFPAPGNDAGTVHCSGASERSGLRHARVPPCCETETGAQHAGNENSGAEKRTGIRNRGEAAVAAANSQH